MILWTNDVGLAMGLILIISQAHGLDSYWANILLHSSIPCISISVSLNVLLTLMIVIRLVLHSRNIRAATGSPAGINGVCKAVVTMLIESSALYAVNSLILIALWVADNDAAGAFIPILAETQVRTFSWLLPSDKSSNTTMDLAGHRSIAHH